MKPIKIYTILLTFLILTTSLFAENTKKLEDTLAKTKKNYGLKHYKTADAFYNLGQEFENNQNYIKALYNYEQSLVISKDYYGESHINLIPVYIGLGNANFEMVNYVSAFTYYQKAFNICKEMYGLEYPTTAQAIALLSRIYIKQNQIEKAVRYARRAIEIIESTYKSSENDYSQAICYEVLAEAHISYGKLGQATKYYEEAFNYAKTIYGYDNKKSLHYLEKIAEFSEQLGDYKKALASYKQALDLIKKLFTNKSIQYADTIFKIAEMNKRQGLNDKVIPAFKEALIIYKKKLGIKHKKVYNTLIKIAYHYKQEKKIKNAIRYFQNARLLGMSLYKEKEIRLLECYIGLGDCWHKLGEYDKAIDYYNEITTLILKTKNPNIYSNDLLINYAKLGDNYYLLKKYKKGITEYRKVLNKYKANTEKHIYYLDRVALGFFELKLYKEASVYYERSISLVNEFYNPIVSLMAYRHTKLGYSYKEIGEIKKSLENYKKALEIEKNLSDEKGESFKIAICMNNLAGAYDALKKYDKALELFEKAEIILIKHLDPGAYEIKTVRDNIKNTKYKKANKI